MTADRQTVTKQSLNFFSVAAITRQLGQSPEFMGNVTIIPLAN